MDNLNKRSVSEVIVILEHTNKEIIKKIPQKFLKFLYEVQDKNYKVDLDFSAPDWDSNLDEDTKAILALIYRDCIVSKEERIKLIEEENEEKKKNDEILRAKYNPNNMFKKREEKNFEELNNTQLIVIKESPWYKRLYKKILSLFGKL